MKRQAFKSVGEIRSKGRLQLVHSDVCSPMPTESIGGSRYFVTFIDDYSRCYRVFFMKSKSEVPEKFKEFEALVSNQLTVPHSPQQNGVAERMNRTLMESARSMLTHEGLPDRYWAEAVATAAYVRNRTPTTTVKTPYEMWYGKRPNIQHLRLFGCIAYAHVPDAN